jgi:diguanylate cyclase (GGDEF)-like protein
MTTIQRLASFITVSTAELEKTNALLAEANRKLSYVAAHDGLTGLLNRESIESVLHRLVWERKKDQVEFSAIMIDLDDFKSINDIHGHSEGDRVLKEVSSIFMDEIKPPQKAGRWGGDEFVIFLPDTGEDKAFSLAERLKKEFQRLVKCGGKSVSASFGVTSSKEGETFDSFYRKMDTALYHAKFKGKNRIFII